MFRKHISRNERWRTRETIVLLYKILGLEVQAWTLSNLFHLVSMALK